MSTTTWDSECEELRQEMHLSAKEILDHHGFTQARGYDMTLSQLLCAHFNLRTLQDISDLTTDFYIEGISGATVPDLNKLARLVQKCRLVEGQTYEVRFDKKRSAKDLLFKYGLREAFYISEHCHLKTFRDIGNLTTTTINSLPIESREKIKLIALCRACGSSVPGVYESYSDAQKQNVRDYANERYQEERAVLHRRQDERQNARSERKRAADLASYEERKANSQKAPKYSGSVLNDLLLQLQASC
jgi:hypothetical protein